eukprot:COSAG01_NODE_47795_length_387_cov_0.527778_1_plen_43_part_10
MLRQPAMASHSTASLRLPAAYGSTKGFSLLSSPWQYTVYSSWI